MIKTPALSAIKGIRHGFFTRQGGHSSGLYASLNTGLGADEDNDVILKNRQIVANELGGREVVTPYQYHSAVALVVDQPWHWDKPPKADALVTRQKGIAIAVNTADCTPVLFADSKSGVVGVAHSGWQGTVSGVLEATVEAMTGLGSRAADIVVAIGPTISQANYEVGPEFVERFVKDNRDSAKFFVPAEKPGHAMFDLPGCVVDRLSRLGLAKTENLGLCTYGDEDRFFSYRRMTHRGEVDYGRQMSGICLV
jgi:YfiH family protein